MKIFLHLIFTTIFLLQINIAQEVKIEFTMNNGVVVNDFNLGLDPSGTNGKDAIELELPPNPPLEVFFAWLEITDPTLGKLNVRDDFRNGDNSSLSIGKSITHKIKWQLGNDGVGPTLCWDIFGVTLNLKDEFGGSVVDYDVTTDGPGCFTIANSALTSLLVTVNYITPPFSLSDKGLFDFKIFMEGPYNSGEMSTSLNSILPSTQPFAGSLWNYGGNESVTEIPTNIVDWVFVELRTELNTPTNKKRAAFLRNDGSVVDIDGISKLKIYGIIPGDYYVVVKHRNHLSVMSAISLTIEGP